MMTRGFHAHSVALPYKDGNIVLNGSGGKRNPSLICSHMTLVNQNALDVIEENRL